jgi:quinol monooxygenase YgiN
MTMTAQPGRGTELAALLLQVAESLRGFPGCEVYVIARDAQAPDSVRVIEVWQDDASAQAALNATPTDGPKPAEVMALLDGPPERTDLDVLGGAGLPPTDGPT